MLGERESGTAKLEEAVAAFRDALKEYTRARVPLEWAKSTGNQGVALMHLAERTRDAALAETAFRQIEAASETLRAGGDTDYFDARLAKARAIRDQLKAPSVSVDSANNIVVNVTGISTEQIEALVASRVSELQQPTWWLKLWHEQHSAVLTALACLAILAIYLGYFAAMLLLAPAGLARLGPAGVIGEMPKPDGTLGWIVSLARLGMEKLALPWFVHHPRVRRAWSIEYRNGRVKIEDFGKPARESFLKAPEVLDVWVESRIVQVRQALDDLELFDRRRIYVEVPVRLGSRETGRVIERPRPEVLRDTFARPRAVVPIIGTGGSGKSTLACAMARWAMADDPTIRLAVHRMVPVFVVQDTTDLLGAVTRNLREMLGEEELPDDLVRSLLSRKRVLVIVDALSERETESQQHVEQVFKDSVGVVFNAVIITSRTEPQLGAVERTTLFPLRLDTKRIVPFIVGYLARLENVEALQEGDAQLDLGKRILAIAEAGGDETPVTPLLVTLFVDSAVRRTAAGQSLDGMPHAVPEIFVDYLRRVNAGRPGEAGVTEDSFIAAAQCLAAVSLGFKFVPGDFMRADAVAALKAAGFSDSAAALLDRLVAGGVIERRPLGGVPALRFSLDPGAEYLAAIPQIFMLRQGAAPAFEGYFVKLRNIDGYPTLLEGYLAAFATCYRAYQPELRLPEISFPWEQATRNRRRPKPVRHPPKD